MDRFEFFFFRFIRVYLVIAILFSIIELALVVGGCGTPNGASFCYW
ncbi:hypothetical protein LEP1GSC021_1679 [Leptospira noguchii str. 1993005606]|uniref:Lipoprotein n=1 Tax=Leptospira noguchii str. 2007001578 TaxID=1049974 RepID=A0ABP2T6L6_9LEPT|nr:hypothetical protein LEP1GSC035_0708 [Leptospira noguchii str. 2007001578]EPE83564.1 hypothetical protein LEP1GSC021_1679 [Leptospira noguchii str. 1993005606]